MAPILVRFLFTCSLFYRGTGLFQTTHFIKMWLTWFTIQYFFILSFWGLLADLRALPDTVVRLSRHRSRLSTKRWTRGTKLFQCRLSWYTPSCMFRLAFSALLLSIDRESSTSFFVPPLVSFRWLCVLSVSLLLIGWLNQVSLLLCLFTCPHWRYLQVSAYF